jgi:hypothetical protein
MRTSVASIPHLRVSAGPRYRPAQCDALAVIGKHAMMRIKKKYAHVHSSHAVIAALRGRGLKTEFSRFNTLPFNAAT